MILRYKDIHAFDNNKTMKIIYSMYRASEISIHRACCKQATQPYSLGGGGYDLSRLKTRSCYHTLSENRNRVFTHSLDVNFKMYKFTSSGYVPVYVHIIYSQSISCRRSLSHWESHVFQPHMVFILSFNIAVSRVILQHWQWQSVGYGPVKDVKICFRTSNLTGLSKICSAASALPLCLDD